jgi:hypothetical protein
VPGHKGVPGNKKADEFAKRGAANPAEGNIYSRRYQRTASRAFLKRKATDQRRQQTMEWIRTHLVGRFSYRLPRKVGFRKALQGVPKKSASRFFQFATGHALTAPYLMEKLKKHPSDECWWCEEGKRQTREHLFKECSRWRQEIKELWRRVAEDVGWRRAKWRPISVR